MPVCCFSFWYRLASSSRFFLRPESLVLISVRSPVRLLSSYSFFSFYFFMYWNFSLVWVKITTVVVIFLRSLCSSSFLSSIFSLSVWFSILSCSKSIKCNPSASCSFFFKIFSRFAWRLRRAIFWSRYWCTSWSFSVSTPSQSLITLAFNFLPVRLKTAFWATLRFNSLNWCSISLHLAYFSLSLA